MADPNTLQDAGKVAGTLLGGGGVLVLIGKFLGPLLQGWITGTAGIEKELRNDMRVELQRVAADLVKARDEIDELRLQTRALSRDFLRVYGERERARAIVNQLERAANKPETVWPPEPVAPLPNPPT